MVKRVQKLLCAAMVLAAGASLGLAQTVEPGDSADLLVTPVSPCETDAMLDPNAPAGASATADCDETAGTLSGSATLNVTGVAYELDASASIHYMFEVGSDAETAGNMIGGALDYELSWSDMLAATPLGTASVAVEIEVSDVTDPMSPSSLLKRGVHSRGLLCDGVPLPACDGSAQPGSGMDADNILLILQRGNVYRVSVRVLSMSTTGETLVPQFADAGISATINALGLSLQRDVAELEEQVQENTERIEALEEDVEMLQMDVAELEGRVETLEVENADQQAQIDALMQALEDLADVVANHTHTYLTGRGVGHNNTVAETSAPDMEVEPTKPGNGHNDDDMDDRATRLEEVAPGRQRLGNRGNKRR